MPIKLKAALSARRVQTLNKPGSYADGGGLELIVKDGSRKTWILRVMVDGKRIVRGLGPYPQVSLADARALAVEYREALLAGRDPSIEAKAEREAEKAMKEAEASIPTFGQMASAVIATRRPVWSNAKHAAQWESTLATYASSLSDKRIDEITTADVLAVLKPIWTSKRETATRTRQRMETVFDWAIGHGYRQDNPAGKHVLKVLPSNKPMKKHHRALPYGEVPAALRKVMMSTSYPLSKLALRLLVLTATRSGEVRFADWSEVDWENAAWTIPAAKMKAGREHRIPLSRQAMETLREAYAFSGPDGLMFPAPRSGNALSDMTFAQLLRRQSIPSTAHGLRSSFRDWAAECSGASWAVCEAALAHTIGNSTEQAYMRSDLFAQRRKLMQLWADFLDCRDTSGAK